MRFDKVELSGLIVLFVGVGLLAFTFFSAYGFLVGVLSIPGSQNLLRAFGDALGPLFEAIIRILYLGIMGWIGSILTIRGIQLLKKERTEASSPPQQSTKTENKQVSRQESKPETKDPPKNEVEKPPKVKEEETIPTTENPKSIETPGEAAGPSLPSSSAPPLVPAPTSTLAPQ